MVKIDAELFSSLATQYDVRSIPTLILFEEGHELRRCSGNQTPQTLEKFIQ